MCLQDTPEPILQQINLVLSAGNYLGYEDGNKFLLNKSQQPIIYHAETETHQAEIRSHFYTQGGGSHFLLQPNIRQMIVKNWKWMTWKIVSKTCLDRRVLYTDLIWSFLCLFLWGIIWLLLNIIKLGIWPLTRKFERISVFSFSTFVQILFAGLLTTDLKCRGGWPLILSAEVVDHWLEVSRWLTTDFKCRGCWPLILSAEVVDHWLQVSRWLTTDLKCRGGWPLTWSVEVVDHWLQVSRWLTTDFKCRGCWPLTSSVEVVDH